ncbi:multicopper oxidase domain-containing protein [Streptomyces sp. NPDC001795]|uniref:multicopper oxidase domain-containing protein n=1 Tax=unclassified Streptomyces TaxID=2593676 RepID=UPI0033192571
MQDPNRVDIRSKLNTVEEWTIRSDSDEEHSFHVHTNHFQLMRDPRCPGGCGRGEGGR